MPIIRCTKNQNRFSIVLTSALNAITCGINSNSKLNVQKTKRGIMKNVCSVLTILTLAVSCGPRKKVIVENPYNDSDLKNRVTDLEQRVQALELGHMSNVASINASQAQINALIDGQNTLASDLANLSESLSELQSLTVEEFDELNSKLEAVEAAVESLEASSESSIAAANSSIASLSSYVDQLVNLGVAESNFLRNEIAALQASVAAQSSTNTSQDGQLLSLQTTIAALQASANAQQAQITTLLTTENIVEFIDPCGDGPGYDEVILKTSSGKFVAYFESGSNRFLSVLSPGNYQTTDQQACQFSINGSNQLVSSNGSSVPAGATHKLLLCGIEAYKVPTGISFNGNTYTNSFNYNGCSVTVNGNGNSVSSNGGSVPHATSCNYNGISSYNSTSKTYLTGNDSSACYVQKL